MSPDTAECPPRESTLVENRGFRRCLLEVTVQMPVPWRLRVGLAALPLPRERVGNWLPHSETMGLN